MIRALMNIIFALRNKLQSFASFFVNKSKDSNGKFKYMSPKSLKIAIYTMLIVFFVSVVVINFFTSDKKTVGGFESFKKEMMPTTGVNSDTDIFSTSNNVSALEFSPGLNKSRTDPLANLTDDPKGLGSANGEIKAELTATDCLNLNDKIKTNTKLTDVESAQAQECLDKNIASLTETEQAAMRKLMDPNVSEEEKKLIRKKLNSELEPGSAEDKIMSQLLDGNPDAEKCVEPLKSRDKKMAELCAKSLDGDELTPEQIQALKVYEDKIKKDLEDKAKANPEKVAGNEQSLTGNNEEDAKKIAKELAENEEKIKDLEQSLKNAEKFAQDAAKKIAAGRSAQLTASEQEALQKIADLNKQAEILKMEQDARKKEFAKIYKSLSESFMQIDKTMKQTYPSGISVEYADLPVCKPAKSLFVAKKRGPVVTKKISEKEIYLDSDGKALTPDKIKYVQLLRQKKYELDKIKKDIRNPLGGDDNGGNNEFVGERMATTGTSQQKDFNISELNVFNDKSLKPFILTPDMKIPAILDSEILVSSKSKGQVVRMKIVADIHNPATGKMIIPKGSIAIATTSGFDDETGVMDFSVTKISIGSGKTIEVSLNVGSADGTMGLKGQVRDTRGKYLAGAFVTAFSAGALNWFSQQIVQPFTTSTLTADALTGASLSGGAEVLTKIAEMYAQDLQNAPKIYWCPKKVPIILFPN